jgi:hypothetical protein
MTTSASAGGADAGVRVVGAAGLRGSTGAAQRRANLVTALMFGSYAAIHVVVWAVRARRGLDEFLRIRIRIVVPGRDDNPKRQSRLDIGNPQGPLARW